MEIPPGIEKNVKLIDYSSWQIGGNADYFCLPKDKEEIKKYWTWASNEKIPVTFLGGGTNVLISDSGVEGLVICLKNFSSLFNESIVGDDKKFLKFSALAGTSKSELLKIFLKHKLAPALFLAGLPGDAGGGVVMNAGVAENIIPREFCEIVDSFNVVGSPQQWQERSYKNEEVQWAYRHSYGWQPGLIIDITFLWPYEQDENILHKVREANRVRLSKQPLDKPSCGSVFVNPIGHKAAQLIDSCGLKGFRIGDAQVSLKHANFIINVGNATAKDVLDVIAHVQEVVEEKKHVKLKTEVILLGRT